VGEVAEPARRGERLENAGTLLQGVLTGAGDLAEDRHDERMDLFHRHGHPGNVDELPQPGLDLLGEGAR
jgi:hypothetical protein